MRPATEVDAQVNLTPSPTCECMVCDLPPEVDHGPVQWNLTLWFPGPFPHEGEADMLLCDRCGNDWVDGEWDPPYDNFIITQLTRI